MLGVAGAGFSDAEVADLAFLLLPQQRWGDHIAGPIISLGRNAVELEDVDAIYA